MRYNGQKRNPIRGTDAISEPERPVSLTNRNAAKTEEVGLESSVSEWEGDSYACSDPWLRPWLPFLN